MPSLVYHAGALGDFITAIPAIRLWKSRRGNAPLVLLGKPEIGRFAVAAGIVDRCIDAGGRECIPLFSPRPSHETRTLLSPFSSALLFAATDSPLIRAVERCGIDVHRQPPFPAARIHAADYHCRLLAASRTLSDSETAPRIVMPPGIIAASHTIMPADVKAVALHPGSGSALKNWPLDRFVAVAGYLRAETVPLLWIQGPAEESLRLPPCDYCAGNQPLSLIAALLGRCRLFIGNDSGITHLAAATGCPTVALFGPSDPAVWAPRGERVWVVCKNKPCAPCHRRPLPGGIRCDASCLGDISVVEVMEKIREIRAIVK